MPKDTRAISDIAVKDACYHRNGVGGIGFFAVEFSFKGDDETTRFAVATVCSQDVATAGRGLQVRNPATRVLMFRGPGALDITETMRGDCFHEALCAYLLKKEYA